MTEQAEEVPDDDNHQPSGRRECPHELSTGIAAALNLFDPPEVIDEARPSPERERSANPQPSPGSGVAECTAERTREHLRAIAMPGSMALGQPGRWQQFAT